MPAGEMCCMGQRRDGGRSTVVHRNRPADSAGSQDDALRNFRHRPAKFRTSLCPAAASG
jgi:hypothetical protein